MCDCPKPKQGMRIRTKRKIERFPNFSLTMIDEGTIVTATDALISVKMDNFIKGAEEWDNCIEYYPYRMDNFWDDFDPIESELTDKTKESDMMKRMKEALENLGKDEFVEEYNRFFTPHLTENDVDWDLAE